MQILTRSHEHKNTHGNGWTGRICSECVDRRTCYNSRKEGENRKEREKDGRKENEGESEREETANEREGESEREGTANEREGESKREREKVREKEQLTRERERVLDSIRPETNNSVLSWINTRISFLLPFTPALDNIYNFLFWSDFVDLSFLVFNCFWHLFLCNFSHCKQYWNIYSNKSCHFFGDTIFSKLNHCLVLKEE